MAMTRRLRRNKTRKGEPLHPQAVNLYKFIRLVLGTSIPDCKIAAKWHMDAKNWSEFKHGRYPVPRLPKLKELARVLGINKHLVFEVAGGTSAQKVYALSKKKDISGQLKLLFNLPNESVNCTVNL